MPVEPPSDIITPQLDMPSSPNITVEQTHYFEDHHQRETHHQPDITVPGTKNLFIYYALSTTGDNVKVMADGGATISLLKERDSAMLGKQRRIGTTTLTGVGNQKLSTSAPTVQLSLSSVFDRKMERCNFEAAVLTDITTIPHRDHTQAIKTVLEVLHNIMPEFMDENADYINMDNFQTGYQGGDVTLLLGIPQLSFHPKVIIQFSNGPAIAMIRQPTQSNKFLILAGPARSAEFLKKARVEVEKDTVKELGMAHTKEDAQTHEVHCVGNRHVKFNEHEAYYAGIQHAEVTEYGNVKEDSRMVEHEATSTTQDIQGRQEEEEHNIEEECKYEKRIQEEGEPNTKPVNGDEVIVNYTSIKVMGQEWITHMNKSHINSFLEQHQQQKDLSLQYHQ